jgi:hypothetical protein
MMLRIIRLFFWFMMGRRLPRKSEYVGFVHGVTHFLGEDGAVTDKAHGFWVLSVKEGKRIVELIGNPGSSAYALGKKAEVVGWERGGPVPPLGYYREDEPPPKPRKSKPTPKKGGNVVFLPRKSA